MRNRHQRRTALLCQMLMKITTLRHVYGHAPPARGGQTVKRYVAQRFLTMILVLFGVIVLVFLSLHLAPGDPVNMLIPMDVSGSAAVERAEEIRAELGLDQPLPIQFVRYLRDIVTLDLGKSILSGQPVGPELFQRFPATLQLGVAALLLAMIIGVPLGIAAALKRNTWVDNTVMLFALSGVSFPNFFLGTLLILLFGLLWPILPPSGYTTASVFTWVGFQYLILPTITLAVGPAATIARLTRSTMLDVLHEDYVRTARAKGLSPRRVTYKHALRNALIPVITVLGIQVGYLLGGAVVVESVFSWPGVGRYMLAGLVGRDYPVVQATALILSSVFVFVVFLTDLSYSLIDPRIRYS